MFTCGPAFWLSGGPPPSFVTALTSVLVGDTLTIPAHNANDLLVVFARSGAPATIPGLISGFTSIATEAPSFGNGWRVMYAFDAANSISSITSASAQGFIVHIYRGFSAIGASAVSTSALGPPGTVPGLTLAATNGFSWVASFVTSNQSFAFSTDPSGMTERIIDANAVGGGNMSSYDTAGKVSSFPAKSVSWSGGGAFTSGISVELRANSG